MDAPFDYYYYFCYCRILKFYIMPKLTQEQLLKIQKNLKVGKCPNCGYEGDKDLSPQEFNLLTLDVDGLNTFDPNKTGSFPIIITVCPNCGFISSFARKFICR